MSIKTLQIFSLSRLLWLSIALGAATGIYAAKTPAHAIGVMFCSFTMSNEAFGNVDVLPGAPFTTNAMLNISCNGAAILPTTIFICISFPTAFTMQGPSTSTLNYQILGPPPATSPWSSTTALALPVSGTIASFTASGTFQISATLLGSQQSALPGSYTQTATANVAYDTTTCTSGLLNMTGSFSYTTTATVVKSCYVNASNLQFPSAGDLNSPISGQSEIDVQCSNGIGYTVGLNGGLSGATDPTQRQMTFGTSFITYGLYQDMNHSMPWGSTANVASGTGTSISQPYPVYGLVPVQATPPIGTYSDTVVVSVAY